MQSSDVLQPQSARRELGERLSQMTVEQVRRYLARRTRVGKKTVDCLLTDRRSAVRVMGTVFRSRLRAEQRERRRLRHLCDIEDELYAAGAGRVVGVDEAGRSPLPDPSSPPRVLPRDARIKHSTTEAARRAHPRRLFDEVTREALDWAVGVSSPHAVEPGKIYQASVRRCGRNRRLEASDFASLSTAGIRDFRILIARWCTGDARCRSIAGLRSLPR